MYNVLCCAGEDENVEHIIAKCEVTMLREPIMGIV